MRFLIYLGFLSFTLTPALNAEVLTTATGIALSSPWKEALYQFSVENLKHPSWGLAHAERDYQLTKTILETAKEAFDEDVLFASAFLHDLGGMDAFTVENVDHAVRSAELAEEKLPAMGFPVAKIPAVKELILGHVYYGPKPEGIFAQAFRDADMLDFLGAMGIARLFGATKDLDPTFSSLLPATATIKKFHMDFPEKISLDASKGILDQKLKEAAGFMKSLKDSSYGEKAL